MPRIDSQTFYLKAIESFGITPRGVHWLSKQSQEVRFKVLLEMLPKDLSNYSICDAGCGFGDLYLYMKKHKRIAKRYVGVDSLKPMCKIAKERTKCKIVCIDLTQQSPPLSDYVVCSGALNVLHSFETYMFIQNCFGSCSKGFIFNALYGEKDSQTYNYLTSKKIESMAKELGITKIILRDGYLENDITVAFLKGEI